jgi:hypothetical protein
MPSSKLGADEFRESLDFTISEDIFTSTLNRTELQII